MMSCPEDILPAANLNHTKGYTYIPSISGQYSVKTSPIFAHHSSVAPCPSNVSSQVDTSYHLPIGGEQHRSDLARFKIGVIDSMLTMRHGRTFIMLARDIRYKCNSMMKPITEQAVVFPHRREDSLG